MIDAEPSLHAAEGISGPKLRSYLVAKGWNARSSRVQGMSILSRHVPHSDKLVEILVPVSGEFDEKLRRIADALRSVAAMEGRSEVDVANDVRIFTALAPSVTADLPAKQLSKGAEFRAYAVDCMRMAATINDPVRKLSMVQMAEAWNRLADHIDLAKDFLSEDSVAGGTPSGPKSR